MGLRALNHIEQVLDGRVTGGAFACDVIEACGGEVEMQAAAIVWCREVAGRRQHRSLEGAAPAVMFSAIECPGIETGYVASSRAPRQ